MLIFCLVLLNLLCVIALDYFFGFDRVVGSLLVGMVMIVVMLFSLRLRVYFIRRRLLRARLVMEQCVREMRELRDRCVSHIREYEVMLSSGVVSDIDGELRMGISRLREECVLLDERISIGESSILECDRLLGGV